MWRSMVFAVIGCAAEPIPVAPTPPDAAAIFAASEQVYAHAKSYVDRGTAVTVLTGGSTHTDRKSFTTAFVRGGRFRFEYREGDDRDRAYVIWSNGTDTLSAWSIQPGLQHEESLDMAIGGATGVSSSTAYNVPIMLFPQFGEGPYRNLRTPQLEGSETIAGHLCWRIQTTTPTGAREWLWIDQRSRLLRRLRKARHFPAEQDHPAFDAETVIDYEPSLDRPLSDDLFRRPEPVVIRQPSWIGVRPDPKSTTLRGVVPDAPAGKAGLKTGDEIVSIDGQAIASGSDIPARTRALAPGKPVKFVVRRDGAELTIEVTPEPRPEQLASTIIDKPAPAIAGTSFGGKVTVVEFWATWCGPCEITAPQLEALHRKYADLRIVGVTDDAAIDVAKYVAAHKLTYAMVLDPDDTAARDYLVQALPTILVIDKTGVVRIAEVGVPDFAELETKIVQLMK